MKRSEIEFEVAHADYLSDINPAELSKGAKLNFFARLILNAIWPYLKVELAKRINPKIVDIIDFAVNGARQ